MHEVLAVDAGGTSSRAQVVDAQGRTRGSGRAGGGNPTSRGASDAAAAVLAAMAGALSTPGVDPAAIGLVLVAHAGERLPAYSEGIRAGLSMLGVAAPLVCEGDLPALFASGTHETAGVAMVAGTGAIAGAVDDGAVARVVDGNGWLLGDAGSGFSIGHRVARAVVADLDGGPATALTPALLDALGIARDERLREGRPVVLCDLIAALYRGRPVELAAFAPLAFAAAADDDAVASTIVRDAVAALAALLHLARATQPTGPTVLGGSVLVHGVLRADPGLTGPLDAAITSAAPRIASDGLTGATVLALRRIGVPVDAALFERIASPDA